MNSRTLNRKIIKNRIIQSAVAEFSERGFTNARIDSIAAAAGINPSRIYYYTGSKKNLYGYVLSYVFQNVEDRLLQPLFSHFDKMHDEPDVKLSLLMYSFAMINDHTAVRSLRQICIRDALDGRDITSGYMKKYIFKYLYSAENIIKEGIRKGIFEISDTSMLVMSILSILKSSSADNPFVIRNDSLKNPGFEEMHKSLSGFVFKSLAPAGKMQVIPELDDDKKRLYAGLFSDLK